MKLKMIVFISWTIAFSLVTSFGGAQSLVLSGEIPMPNGHTFDLLGYFNGKITLLEEDGRNVTLHQLMMIFRRSMLLRSSIIANAVTCLAMYLKTVC